MPRPPFLPRSAVGDMRRRVARGARRLAAVVDGDNAIAVDDHVAVDTRADADIADDEPSGPDDPPTTRSADDEDAEGTAFRALIPNAVGRDARIVVAGTEMGPCLRALRLAGYGRTEVIVAAEALADEFAADPALEDMTVHVGPLTEVLAEIPDDSVATAIVVEVLGGADSAELVEQIVRVAGWALAVEPRELSTDDRVQRRPPSSSTTWCGPQRNIVSIQPAPWVSHRQFPHDIPDVFASRGLVMTFERSMADFLSTAGDGSIERYTAWRFARPSR